MVKRILSTKPPTTSTFIECNKTQTMSGRIKRGVKERVIYIKYFILPNKLLVFGVKGLGYFPEKSLIFLMCADKLTV